MFLSALSLPQFELNSSMFVLGEPVKGLGSSVKADHIQRHIAQEVKNQLPAGGLTTGSHHRIVADTIRPQPARPGDSRT